MQAKLINHMRPQPIKEVVTQLGDRTVKLVALTKGSIFSDPLPQELAEVLLSYPVVARSGYLERGIVAKYPGGSDSAVQG